MVGDEKVTSQSDGYGENQSLSLKPFQTRRLPRIAFPLRLMAKCLIFSVGRPKQPLDVW